MVSLPQYGGEGQEAYKGNKSNASLTQLGGEGGSIKIQSDMKLLKFDSEEMCGPGRYLKTSK